MKGLRPFRRIWIVGAAAAFGLVVILGVGIGVRLSPSKVDVAGVQVSAAQSQTPPTYFTSFPATENPISESSNWINGGTAGLAWTNVRTTTNKVFGTQSGTSSPPFDDSIAALTGTWGNDQAAAATVFVTSAPTGCCTEVELHLRRTITPNFSGGYEFTCGIQPGSNYVGINRWPGPKGTQLSDFVGIAFRQDMGCANGDVIGATAVGSTLTFYKNGVAVLSGTDTTFTGGAPGVGFYVQGNAGTISDYGFTNFAANDSGMLPALVPAIPQPTAQPTAIPRPTAQPTAIPQPTAQPTAILQPTAQPTATPHQIAQPTATPMRAALPTATSIPVANSGCIVVARLNGVDTNFSRPAAFCANQ
jgi:hypothetical protein